MGDLNLKFRKSRDYTFDTLIRDLQDYTEEQKIELMQYLRRDGSQPMLGPLDMDGFNILDVGEHPGTFYQRGTWTPIMDQLNGTPDTPTYAAQVGYYTRIGGIAFISFRIVVTDLNGMTGWLRIGGVPFHHAIQTGAGNRETISVSFYTNLSANVPPNASRLFGWFQDSGSAFRLYWEETQLGRAITQVTDANFVSAVTIYGSGFYAIY